MIKYKDIKGIRDTLVYHARDLALPALVSGLLITGAMAGFSHCDGNSATRYRSANNPGVIDSIIDFGYDHDHRRR